MWNFLRKFSAFIKLDIENPENKQAACLIHDMMYCVRSKEEIISELLEIKSLSEYFNGNIAIEKSVPNEETAFVLYSALALKTTLLNSNYLLAYDIADVIRNLPDIESLSDKNVIKSFNQNYIDKVNEKYGYKVIPSLPALGKK